MLLWSLVSPSSAAPVRTTLGQVGDAVAIDVPLIRGEGDTRPRVAVHLAEDERPILAVLDLGGEGIHIGSTMAARLGLTVRHGRAHLDLLRIGEVLVEGAIAEVGRPEELRIGVGALSDLGVAVLPSEGMVRFARDADGLLARIGPSIAVAPGLRMRWRERGTVRTAEVGDAVPAGVTGASQAEGLLRLQSDRARSTLGAGVLGEALQLQVTISVAGIEVPLVALRDEGLADPRSTVPGELGADALASLDLAVGGGRLAVREAPEAHWTDADTVRRSWLEAEAPGWDAIRARRGWTELAELRRATGDIDGALAADAALEPLIGDRCELWLAIGLHRLRAGAPGATEALDRSADAYATWVALGPELRDRVRYGRKLPAVVSSTRQPVACEQASGVAQGLPETEAGLRAAGAYTVLSARHPNAEPSRAWARTVAGQADPHPLTTAWLLGPELVAVALDASPDWIAGRLATAAWTSTVPEDLGREVARMAVLRPGDPSVACQVALHAALVSDEAIPTGTIEADCLAAAILVALNRGDAEIAGVTRSLFHARWPDLVPDDAGGVARHTGAP